MRNRISKIDLIEFVCLAVLVIILSVWGYSLNFDGVMRNSPFERRSELLRVAFLDVGQGDSALVKTADNKKILIDGGDEGSGDTLRSYFASYSVDKLDAVIVSHYHSDHTTGVYELLDEFPIDTLYMPDVESKNEIHYQLSDTAKRYNVDVEYIDYGDFIEFEDGTVLNVLFPCEEFYSNIEENTNNDSLVIKLSYGNSDFLFMADLESDAEKALMKNADIDSEVLKVGHHGSKSSTGKSFLKAVSPQIAVISVGKNNSYNHPHTKTTEKLENFGAEIYRTDLNGNIVVIADKDGNVEVKTEK